MVSAQQVMHIYIEIAELVKLFHYFSHSEDLSIPCDVKLIVFCLFCNVFPQIFASIFMKSL